jgi:hypothetical protein
MIDLTIAFDEHRCRSVLLQYHGQLEMQEAIRNAFIHNFQTMMGARVETVNPLLILHVNRGTIVQDTIAQVQTNNDHRLCDIKSFV